MTGDTSHQTVLDVETGEPGLPELIPAGAGGVDSVAPKLARSGCGRRRVRARAQRAPAAALTEAARLTLRVEQRAARAGGGS